MGSARFRICVLSAATVVIPSVLPADVVIDWNQKANVCVLEAKMYPFVGTRVMAIVHASMFERQVTWMKYVEMIEKIYNKHVHTHERVSVVFEVDQMERQRRSHTAVKSNATRRERREEKAA